MNSAETATVAEDTLDIQVPALLPNAQKKDTREVGPWKVTYFLGEGETEGNVTTLRWGAVAHTSGLPAKRPEVTNDNTVIMLIGRVAVATTYADTRDEIDRNLLALL